MDARPDIMFQADMVLIFIVRHVPTAVQVISEIFLNLIVIYPREILAMQPAPDNIRQTAIGKRPDIKTQNKTGLYYCPVLL